jgi:1-deoxy-D-xylulose-5-phosphate synthase
VELDAELKPLPIGRGEVVREGEEVALIAIGTGVALAERAADLLSAKGVTPTVVNARFVKPLDEELLLLTAARHRLLCTVEEGTERGGFRAAVLELLHRELDEVPRTRCFAIPDEFVEHGEPERLLSDVGLTPQAIAAEVEHLLVGMRRRVDLGGRRRAKGE